MCCKIFVLFATAVLLNIINKGSALKCNRCYYDSNFPKALQKCGNTTIECSAGYCYSVSFVTNDGVVGVEKSCDNQNYCPSSSESCKRESIKHNLKSCDARCCSTDNCNKDRVLRCNQCYYDSRYPKALQKCGNTTIECSTGYCYSVSFFTNDGVVGVEKSCDNRNYCPSSSESCKRESITRNLRSCDGRCCSTDNCNSNKGNALKCNACYYDSSLPKAVQKCGNTTIECSTGYCYSVFFVTNDGVVGVEKSCDTRGYCPNASESCKRESKTRGLKSCDGRCCSTDNCNKGAIGRISTKFVIFVAMIVGYRSV